MENDDEATPSIPARLLMGSIRVYQKVLSPAMGGNCRYYPSCSEYGYDAIRLHGAGRGVAAQNRQAVVTEAGRVHVLAIGRDRQRRIPRPREREVGLIDANHRLAEGDAPDRRVGVCHQSIQRFDGDDGILATPDGRQDTVFQRETDGCRRPGLVIDRKVDGVMQRHAIAICKFSQPLPIECFHKFCSSLGLLTEYQFIHQHQPSRMLGI